MEASRRLAPYAAALLLLVDAALLYLVDVRGPFPAQVMLGTPTAYRNLYIHVPIAIAGYATFTVALIFALLYLVRGEARYERTAHAAIVVGVIYGAATLVTGSIWAYESWGSAWNWDPRETGIFFMWIAYLVYFVLRSSIKDPDVAPRISMSYAVAAYSTIPLSFALPYVMESLHPVISETKAFVGGGLPAVLFPVRMLIVNVIAILMIFMVRDRVTGAGSRVLRAGSAALLFIGLLLVGLYVATLTGARGGLQLTPGATAKFVGTVSEARLLEGTNETATLLLKVYTDGRAVEVRYTGEPPVKPVTFVYRDKETGTTEVRTSLVSHVVLVEGVVGENGIVEAERLEVLNYWGVPVNILMYALFVASAVYLATRPAGRAA